MRGPFVFVQERNESAKEWSALHRRHQLEYEYAFIDRTGSSGYLS